ncbi:MAG: stage V sporulation protein D, partial [Clostridiales bacterium]|nr:stage V sporulation protein D [Clostridiales bacterium]
MVSTGPVIRKRIAILTATFLAIFAVLVGQLFNLQVIRAQELQQRAQTQWTSASTIAPERGAIVDRNGVALALSATAYIASVSPRQVDDPQAFARVLSPILDMDEATIARRASDTSKGGVILKRQLSRDIAQQLRSMYLTHQQSGSRALNGLYLEEDAKRYYPFGAFASQLIGLTTIDGVGQSGLESSLDRYLSGKAGKILDEIDGKGRDYSYGASEYVPSVNGGTAVLTIDYVIQSFAEKAAREAMEVNGAKGIRVLVMNPQTGEVLAMCTKPDFDLNNPPRDDVDLLNELMRNRAIGDAYEPGST